MSVAADSFNSITADSPGGATGTVGWYSTMSADGRYVVYQSNAGNLGDGDLHSNVYVYDQVTHKTLQVSIGLNGALPDGDSIRPEISADGKYIIFTSAADNLVAGDGNGHTPDVYVYALNSFDDPSQNGLSLVSATPEGTQANGDNSLGEAISGGGVFLAFGGMANNLAPVFSFANSPVFNSNDHTTLLDNASLTDPTGAGGPLVVTFSVQHGALSYSPNAIAGLTAIDGDGSDGTLSFSGTLLAINTALAQGLVYTPVAGSENTLDLITLTADNLSGGKTTIAGTINEQNQGLNDHGPNNDASAIYVIDTSDGTKGIILEDANATALSTSGTLLFTDIDDTHTVSAAAVSSDSWGTLTPTLLVDTTGSNTGGEIQWIYQVDAAHMADVIALGAGVIHSDTIAVTVTDSAGTAAIQDVTVFIAGRNEAPVIQPLSAGSPDPGPFTHGNGTPGGTVQFSNDFSFVDPDQGDTHTVAAFFDLAASNVPTGFDPASIGTFEANLVHDGSGDNQGVVHWQMLNASVDALNALPGGTQIVYDVHVIDSHGADAVHQVDITIDAPPDHAPVASQVTLAAGTEDTAYTIHASDLIAGASDIDLDTLSITALSIASGGGDLQDNYDGTWTYTPAANYNGAVSFDYTVSDGTLSDSSTASLTLAAVNDPPVAIADNFTATEAQIDQASFFSKLPVGNLLGNDSDVDGNALHVISISRPTVNESDPGLHILSVHTETGFAGDVARYEIATNSGDAYIAVESDGRVLLWSDFGDDPFRALGVNDHAIINFNYTVSDGQGGTDTASAAITIDGTNDNPNASNDSFTTTELQIEQAGSSSKIAAGNVLGNDSDPDGDHLSVASITAPTVSGISVTSIVSDTSSGEIAGYDIKTSNGDAHIAVKADGSVQLWSDSNEDPFRALGVDDHATINFNYTASDGQGGTDTASASIRVNGSNDAPVITTDDSQTIFENTRFVTALTATDPDGPNPVTFSVSGGDDRDFFKIVNDSLVFKTAPDYEDPDNHHHNNSYVVQVSAFDGHDSTIETITVGVANLQNEQVDNNFGHTLTGQNNKTNYLDGEGGGDTLTGKSLTDVLVGGSGNDTMTGGGGNNIFVFAPNFGKDKITDFTPGQDVIEIDHSIFANIADLLHSAANDTHGNVVITADANDTITLNNVSVLQLQQHQNAFHFV